MHNITNDGILIKGFIPYEIVSSVTNIQLVLLPDWSTRDVFYGVHGKERSCSRGTAGTCQGL